MICANCGKLIAGTTPVTEDGFHFCSNICRLEWRKKGKPTPFRGKQLRGVAGDPTVDVMEFPVEPPGFENRQMRVRLSYWSSPKIFLDGKLLEPVKSGFLARTREYRPQSNFGKEVVLRLRTRPLDPIPLIEIDGQQFPIARPLNTWEYIWMGLPALLVLFGGFIGGAVGFAAVISNAILMRRVRHPLPRYLLTGATTVMAALFFLQSVSIVRPIVERFGLSGSSIDKQIQTVAAEMTARCPITLDKETRLDSAAGHAGKILVYYYTLVNYAADQLDTTQLRQFLLPGILNNIRTNEDMRFLRTNEVTFIYRYADRNGQTSFELRVPPEEYR